MYFLGNAFASLMTQLSVIGFCRIERQEGVPGWRRVEDNETIPSFCHRAGKGTRNYDFLCRGRKELTLHLDDGKNVVYSSRIIFGLTHISREGYSFNVYEMSQLLVLAGRRSSTLLTLI